MGRWSSKLYDSDATLDFFARISDCIIKEITFWTMAEQVLHNTAWLTEIISLIETMLLFDLHQVGSNSHFLEQESAVKRWRDAFFSVWDADWTEENNSKIWGPIPYLAHINRQTHRNVMDKWFNRIEALADEWSREKPSDLEPFHPKERLPYFLRKNEVGYDVPIPGRWLSFLIYDLTHSIVFTLSEDNYDHEDALIFFREIEEIWVAIDVISRLCEAYAMPPHITEGTVDRWLEKTIAIWQEHSGIDSETWDKHKNDSGLYKESLRVFERLKDMARKYPDPLSI